MERSHSPEGDPSGWPSMITYYVYVLKSCVSERYYIGCTAELETRVSDHNKGRTRSTKPYLPWKLIYCEGFENKKDAFKKEWYLKHPKGYLEKLSIIKQFGEVA